MEVLALGGTIASVPAAAGEGVTPRLSPDDLLASVPGVRAVAELRVRTFRQVPSGDLTFDDIAALARELSTVDADGVVVTQGTDTLEETSWLLDLLYAGAMPVVLTGAMRNPALPGADGPANLLAAVRVAASPLAAGLGPLVVFDDEIHLPRYVRKTHTASVGAFASPTAGPVGWVVEDRVRLPFVPRRRTAPHDPGALVPPVPSVGLALIGLDADLPPTASLAGLVVAGFGGGHVPGRLADALAELAGRMPVVLASRTGAGENYRDTYGFPGSERDLLARGLVSAGGLDPLKARVLLTVLLAEGAAPDAIRAAFAAAGD
ncbi:MAG: asparaginase [Jatrophihabitans sp.]|uniref:asparaginase n=1 Tax=Jatrophihabitans sp. TaxID=1932789 RepID=UPI003F808E39